MPNHIFLNGFWPRKPDTMWVDAAYATHLPCSGAQPYLPKTQPWTTGPKKEEKKGGEIKTKNDAEPCHFSDSGFYPTAVQANILR
jgi:hypothetical protein